MMPHATLDHVVVNTRDALDDVAAQFEQLGFLLTPPSRHTLGSLNRTAVFTRDYFELVGIDRDAGVPREELLRSPAGFEGLVFATTDAARLYERLLTTGAPVTPPIEFSRPVALASGMAEARFRVVRVKEVPFGRCYFCQHLTPELVWRPEWRSHANGARAIRRVVIAARDPTALTELFHRLLGEAEASQVEIVASTKRDAIVELELAVASIAAASHVLLAAAVAHVRDGSRIIVSPGAAMGTTIIFSEN